MFFQDITDSNTRIIVKQLIIYKRKNAEYKKGFSSLEIVNYDAVKLEKCRSDDPNFKYRQAEIMIHRTVPIEFIMNIDSPYEFSFNSFKPLPKKITLDF